MSIMKIRVLLKLTVTMLLGQHLLFAQNLPTVSPPESSNSTYKRPSPSDTELYFSTLNKREREQMLVRLSCDPYMKENVDLLLSVGTDPNAYSTRTDISALRQAALCTNYDTVNSLLRRNANTEIKDSFGVTALMTAAENQPLKSNYKEKNIIDLLLGKGAKIDATDRHGNTVLMYLLKGIMSRQVLGLSSADQAIVDNLSEGFVFFLPKLITAGADINGTNSLGETVLHQCVPNTFSSNVLQNNCCPVEVVLSLVEAGIDINKKTKEGKTAVELAREAHRDVPSAFHSRGKCREMEVALNEISRGGTVATIVSRFQLTNYTSIHTGTPPSTSENTTVNSSNRNLPETSSNNDEKTGTNAQNSNNSAR